MKKNLYLYFLSILVSCNLTPEKNVNNETNSSLKKNNSVELNQSATNKSQTEKEIDYILIDTSYKRQLTKENFTPELKKNLKQWVDYYKRKSKDFDISKFQNCDIIFLNPYQQEIGDSIFLMQYFNLYSSYLKFSPDSSMVLDIYSYTWVLDYNSDNELIALKDIDNQVSLIDYNNQKHIILLTDGPVVEYQDAFWLNNDSIIIAWIDLSKGKSFEPRYSMIDLNTYMMHNYIQEDDFEFSLDKNNYFKLVFKGIHFDI